MREGDIAVVGMAAVFPGALTLDQYWYNIVNGVDAIEERPAGRLNGGYNVGLSPSHPAYIACTRGGFIPSTFRFDPLRHGIMPNTVRQGDPDQFMALHIIDAALQDAGVVPAASVRAHTDVIVGRGGYMTNKMAEVYLRVDTVERLMAFLAHRFPEMTQEERTTLSEGLYGSLPPHDTDSLTTCMPNLVASRVANRLNLRGAAYTVDAACASSLIAVEQAVQRLRNGLCDLAVAGGLHLTQSPGFWFVFAQLGALSGSSSIRPFDRQADGLLLGEGAGAVVLKRFAEACRDEDRIYGVIAGVGSASDGRETAVLTPSSTGQVQALRRAYLDAEMDPATIGYVEAHGTATPVGDAAEIATLKAVYGTRNGHPPTRALGSVKSMIGHTMPAAGMASLIKTVLALSNKVLPPSLHCEDPHADLEDAPFYVNTQVRPWIHDTAYHPRRAGVNAFGFGGINAHVIVEEVGTRSRPVGLHPVSRSVRNVLDRPDELLLFTASTPDALIDPLRKLSHFLSREDLGCSLEDLAFSLLDDVEEEEPCKLALICKDLQGLRTALLACIERLQQGEPLTGLPDVYFSASAAEPTGKVAVVFPGFGFPGLLGDYPHRLITLCLHVPDVRAAFDAIEVRDRHPEDPVPTSVLFSPPETFSDETCEGLRRRLAAITLADVATTVAPSERNLSAPGVTLTNWIGSVLLESLGVVPDMLCGQSQGELAALAAGGVVEMEEVLPKFWEALDLTLPTKGIGRLAIVGADEAFLERYSDAFPDVCIAIHVAPSTQIIGGSEDALARLLETLRAERCIAQLLPYPPIHTPHLGYLRDELLRFVDVDMAFKKPQRPIYSALTSSIFPEEEEEVKALALANFDRPVRFWQTMHRMYEDGARLFIQAGGGTLAANIQTVLSETEAVCLSIDADARHPISQVHHLAATFFTHGVRFARASLFAHRAPQQVDWQTGHVASPVVPSGLPLQMDWEAFSRVDQPSVRPPIPERVEGEGPVAVEEPDDLLPGEEPELRMPFVGEVVHHRPGQEISTRCRLDLKEAVFLQDHAFVGPQDVRSVEHRLPVVPLTIAMEIMAETAACLAPGLGVIGFEKVRGLRWIAFQDKDAIELRMEATVQSVDPETGVHAIQVELFAEEMLGATATVLFNDRYRQDVTLHFHRGQAVRTWPLTATEAYRDRHLFHGPAFQCIMALEEFDEHGGTGRLFVDTTEGLFASTPRPQFLTAPFIIDGTAQVFGLWILMHGIYVLPLEIEKMELYRPTPPAGSQVQVRFGLRDHQAEERTMVGDLEVLDEAGYVWMRLRGYRVWQLHYTRQLLDAQRLPARYCISEALELPAGLGEATGCMLERSVLKHVNLEWIARSFLHPDEMASFEALSMQRQWQWLMGRIAAKDAARRWLARHTGGEMLHPASLCIDADAHGSPHLRPLPGLEEVPQISIAHTPKRAVALASEAAVGIDVEPDGPQTEALLTTFARAAEVALLQPLLQQDRGAAWPTRLWCAKEAVAKAVGTGLQGRPADFELSAAEPEGRLSVRYLPSGQEFIVYTCRHKDVLLAYTGLAADLSVQRR